MPDDFPPVPVRFRWWRVLGWGLVVALVATGGWGGWREYDYRAAVREARAAGFDFEESPTPVVVIRADWHAAFLLATWLEHERTLVPPADIDLAPLRSLLVRLDPTQLSAVGGRNVEALRGLSRLRVLVLTGSDVKDLAPLAGLTQLQELCLNRCAGVTDLAPLAGLTHLQKLYLADRTRVSDLAPLTSLAQLQWLDLYGCTGLSAEAVVAFIKSNPHITVAVPW